MRLQALPDWYLAGIGTRLDLATVLDTNAAFEYTTDMLAEGSGSVGRQLVPGPLARYVDALGRIGTVVITRTVVREWTKNIDRRINTKIKRDGFPVDLSDDLLRASSQRLGRLSGGGIQSDLPEMIRDVKGMYARIRDDPAMSGCIDLWRQFKFHARGQGGSGRARPPIVPQDRNAYPGPPSGPNDLVILSTAAVLAKTRPVILVSSDGDFTAFAGRIRDDLGVYVLNGRGFGPPGPRGGPKGI